MERRHFISGGLLLAAWAQDQPQRELQAGVTASTSYTVETVIERKSSGQPHQGKVLAAIQRTATTFRSSPAGPCSSC
jgi:hypothetical protein